VSARLFRGGSDPGDGHTVALKDLGSHRLPSQEQSREEMNGRNLLEKSPGLRRRDKINCLAAADSIAQAPEPDILQIRPNLYGIGLDLRALWRTMFGSHE